MGLKGPIAIDQLVVHKNMELYAVVDKITCFEKVMSMSQYYITKLRETNGN